MNRSAVEVVTASRTTQSAAVDRETEQLPAALVRSGDTTAQNPPPAPGCAYRTARLARCLFPRIPADFATHGDCGRRLALTTDVQGTEVSSMGSAGRFAVDRWRAEDPVAWDGDEAISCPLRSPKTQAHDGGRQLSQGRRGVAPRCCFPGPFSREDLGLFVTPSDAAPGRSSTRQKRRIPA
jgi:hypothetical protein